MLQRIARGFQLRTIGGHFDGYDRLGMSARQSKRTNPIPALFACALTVLAVALLAVLCITFGHAHPTMLASSNHLFPLIGLAGIVKEEKKPANIRKMEADLKAIAKELETGQTEMAAGPISQERGEELEAKAMEMEQLQSHIDQYNRIAGINAKAREVGKVTLPGEREDVQRKLIKTTAGHKFVMSDSFKRFQQNQSGWSPKVDVGRQLGKAVVLRGEEAQAFETKAFDPATLSTIGADGLIYIDRDPEIVRFENPEILTIRDVLNVVPTTSDAIRYVKITELARNAASQPTRGAAKAYLTMNFEPTDVAVQTIAVLSKVTEQDIDDAPRLVGFINGEMTLDVKVEEERQLAWGDGTNGNLLGLFNAANNMPEFSRAEGGDTAIDTIRRMRTDLRKRRVAPNFVTIDPIDWEEIELAKGTTNYYIWGLVSDLRGTRIWSLNVIESDAMTNLETGERRLMVGDGIRGATIYDRSQVQLAVGFVDDDFARNLRTLRCEERLALAVKRAFAFEYAVMEEASS